jgi:hypothetical protein
MPTSRTWSHCAGGALLGGRFGLSWRTRIGALVVGAFCVYVIFQPY